MKYVIIVLASLLVGCSEESKLESSKVDQCLRLELFKSCMASLPKGPDSTVYNDWDEVVSECESAAYYQSLRKHRFIKPECLSGAGR